VVETLVLEDEELSTYDKMIYIALCSFASARDRECFPSVATIARRASCSERQVRISLCFLETLGYIKRDFVTGSATVYTLLDLDERTAHHAGVPGMQDTPALHAGEGGATCRGERHSVPPNKKYLTRTREQEKDTQPSVEAAPQEPNPEIELQTPELSLPALSLPESEVKLLDALDAPAAMRSAANYLLMTTGRESLLEEEIAILRKFNALHFPAVVLKEIDVAAERFKRLGRNPKTLTFLYIADAMKYRKPTRPMTPRESAVKPGRTTPDPDEIPDETESLNT
jgi:hypothetical protein